jgi:poly(A) polymerase Pap1
MENMIKKYLSSGMLVAYILKMLCTGTVTFAETGIVFSLIGMITLQEYFEKHQKIQDISKVVEKQNVVIKEMAQEFSNLKTSMSGLKLQQGMKQTKL